jgi:hypothetical protein
VLGVLVNTLIQIVKALCVWGFMGWLIWLVFFHELEKREPVKQRALVTCEVDDNGKYVDCWEHYDPEVD